jgi:methylglutaconyl-CoA hydratase
MTASPFCVEEKDGFYMVTFNRPDSHNAMDELFITELTHLLKKAEKNPAIKVVILKANGSSFCAGADLNWMKKSIKFSLDENIEDAKKLSILMDTLYTLKKPTIALIHGPVYGGGIGLVACADIVIATESASFCFSEVKLGLIPAIISPYCINLLGERQARRYFLSAELIAAKKALQLSLVHELVEEGGLLEAGLKMAKKISRHSPQALKSIKELSIDINGKDINDAIREKTMNAIATIRVSEEAQEGMTAFFEKRKPNWC